MEKSRMSTLSDCQWFHWPLEDYVLPLRVWNLGRTWAGQLVLQSWNRPLYISWLGDFTKHKRVVKHQQQSDFCVGIWGYNGNTIKYRRHHDRLLPYGRKKYYMAIDCGVKWDLLLMYIIDVCSEFRLSSFRHCGAPRWVASQVWGCWGVKRRAGRCWERFWKQMETALRFPWKRWKTHWKQLLFEWETMICFVFLVGKYTCFFKKIC